MVVEKTAKNKDKRLLTFKDGHFVLTNELGKSVACKDIKDIHVAYSFREYADERVKRIFNRAFVEHYGLPDEALPDFLDPHQKAGVKWIMTRSRSYLAHAPGAGKTCQAIIASLLSTAPGVTLFIVPPSLTANWEREIRLWGTRLDYAFARRGFNPKITIIPDSSKQQSVNWVPNFIICPDSMITKDWVLSRLVKLKKKFVAVDEASRFKEATAQRTIALFGGTLKDGRKSPGLVHEAKHAVLMDGSPMPNRPMELWAPTFAMCPESIDFMTQEDFGFRYCGAKMNDYHRWEFKHSSHEAELKDRLQESFMHVVGEAELSHPERRRSILIMNKDVRSAEHKKWEKQCPFSFSDISEDMNQGEIATFRKELGLRKVSFIADYVSERLSTKNESILLFVWHREVGINLLYKLSKTFKSTSYLRLVIGGTPENEREGAFRDFQSGKCKLLIMNIAAGGRGHNLQKADRVIFGEYSWCDETNIQAEKRASRKGSDKAFVRCEYIVSPGSMDEIILNAVFRKAQTVKKVIG